MKEILLEQIDKLRNIKLPPEWSIANLDVKFRRSGVLGEYATVVYDNMNNTFYVETNKSIIYQEDVKATNEAIEIMKVANKILNNSTKTIKEIEEKAWKYDELNK